MGAPMTAGALTAPASAGIGALSLGAFASSG